MKGPKYNIRGGWLMREQFLRNQRLIAHYYLVAGVAALLFSLSARSEETIDPIILVILAVYVIVFPVVILYTRKYAVHIFFFLLVFIIGFYSCFHFLVDVHFIFTLLYFE